MNESQMEKIHRYLDGDLRREDLTFEELQEAASFEALNTNAQGLYRSIEVPDLTRRIMHRLPALPPATESDERGAGTAGAWLRGLAEWFWAPRSVSLRPAYGIFALLVVLALVIIRDNNLVLQQRLEIAEARAVAGKVFVQFRLDAPQASAVQLAGSFTGWKPMYTLKEVAPGVWSVLVPLTPGVHDYAFVVNGKWTNDPAAAAVDDGFGGANSRMLVLPPDGGSRL